MDYEYKLICEKTIQKLNSSVAEHVKLGFRPMGPHTHEKSYFNDCAMSNQWYNVYCISLDKKT